MQADADLHKREFACLTSRRQASQPWVLRRKVQVLKGKQDPGDAPGRAQDLRWPVLSWAESCSGSLVPWWHPRHMGGPDSNACRMCSRQWAPCPWGWPTAGGAFCNGGCKCPPPSLGSNLLSAKSTKLAQRTQPYWQRTSRSASQTVPVAPAPHFPSRCPFWGRSWSPDHEGQEVGELWERAGLPSCPSFLSAN